ncbi:hypothetical protein MKW98_013471 [Papaver atlanticum]|uniref:PGG domain-containing protein n=1 Tax=Papaver atlanticum TaxID=357466 RepID=A0AAD4SUD0_9MAGN|nr:hypothetical protein MKW98_013471 [Papaver atlanticum]
MVTMATAKENSDIFAAPNDLLASTNYKAWKEYMEVNLKRRDLLEPCISKPYHMNTYKLRDNSIKKKSKLPNDSTSIPALKSFSTELNRDRNALEAIQKSCGPEMLPLIRYAEFASEAWTSLEEAAKDDKKDWYNEMVETAAKSRANLENVPEVNKVLTKRNHAKWIEYMENELTSKHLWNVVNGTDRKGSRGYKLKNRNALVTIKLSCGKDMIDDIYAEENAYDAWRKIENKIVAWRMSEGKREAATIQRPVCISTTDYESWKGDMQKYLKTEGLWGFLDKDNKLDDAEDEKALDAIKLHCPLHMQKFIWYVDCAENAWKELEAEEDEFTEVHHGAHDAEHTIPESYRVLTRSNYDEWSSHMKLRLQRLRLWSVLNNPKDDSIKSISEIKKACALRIIKEACGRDMLSCIFYEKSAYEAWKSLEKAAYRGGKDVYLRHPHLVHAVKIDRFVPEKQNTNKESWRGAKLFFRDFPEALTAEITNDGSTTLHAAVRLGRGDFVTELLKLMSPAQLEATTHKGNTALSLAAKGYNNLEIVKMMAEKNPYLLQIENNEEHSALAIAAINGDETVFRYLYRVTPKEMLWQSGSIGKRISNLLTSAARIDAFDVVLNLLEELFEENLAEFVFSGDANGMNLLTVLAGKPSSFPSGNKFGPIGGLIYWLAGVTKLDGILLKALKAIVPCIKVEPLHSKVQHRQTVKIVELIRPLVCDYKPDKLKESLINDAIHLSTIHGIIEIFKALFSTNLYLEDVKDNEERGLFQIAIVSRQESIFEYISDLGQRNQNIALLDNVGNNTLHCAGLWLQSPHLDKAHIPARFWMQPRQLDKAHGPALQMQREIQWFEEVERVVPPRYREAKNYEKITPKDLFSLHHKGLAEQGEKWMKDTSHACMLVTTLIATVMFAAAFTLPGGSDQNTGRSLIATSAAFKVFVVCDAVSLFSSCTSVLMFFSILTARFAERDFLISLPRKLILGLSTLFISIATMMATFAATLVIVLRGEASWVYIPVSVLASIPVLLFGLLQLPLFYHIVKSTYGRDIHRWIRFTFSILCCRKRVSSSPLICITCCQ